MGTKFAELNAEWIQQKQGTRNEKSVCGDLQQNIYLCGGKAIDGRSVCHPLYLGGCSCLPLSS